MQVVSEEFKSSMVLIAKLSELPPQNRDHALEYFGNVIAQLIDMPRVGHQFVRFHFTLDFDEKTGMVGVQFLDKSDVVNPTVMANFKKLVASRDIPHTVNDKDEVVMSTANLFDRFFPKGHLDLLDIKTPMRVH